MKLSEPLRWCILTAELGAMAAAICWGLDCWQPKDFEHLPDSFGVALTLAFCGISGGAVWSFYALFPTILRAVDVVSHVLVTVVFALAFASVVALSMGVNQLGEPATAEHLVGTLTAYRAGRRASNASKQGHYGVVEVPGGDTFEVPRSVLDDHNLRIGDAVPLELHRGNLYDWGWVR